MPAPDAGRAFALVVVDELVRHGVRDVVLSPGSRSTPLALAFAEDGRIRLHVRIDERSASFCALGIARAGGRVVPLLCTSGTAAAEFHAAVLEADQSRVPLLVLTADRPPELRGIGANQTIDQVKLYGGAVRWFDEVGVPESLPEAVGYWRSTISEALAAAAGSLGTAGPVHLNVALREPLVPVGDEVGFPYDLDGRGDGRPWTAADGAARALPDQTSALLDRAGTGVVVAGDGLSADDVAGIHAFAATRGWPVVAEAHSNARRGPNAVSSYEALLRDADFVASHRPELAVVCGRVGLTRTLLGWLRTTPHVVIDGDGRWWDVSRTAMSVVAAAPAALRTASGAAAPAGWLQEWQVTGAAAADAMDGVLDGDGPMTEPRLARDLAAGLPPGALLTVASSMPIRDVDLTMRPRDGLKLVANRGVSGIDGFVSTAVGAALVHDGPAWALAGDLSLLHDVNGLQGEPRADLTLVVVNNDGGGIFSLLPQAGGDAATFERLFGTPHGVDVERLVTAYGAAYAGLQSPVDLAAAVQQRPEGVRVLELRSERRANAELHRELTSAAADAVAARPWA